MNIHRPMLALWIGAFLFAAWHTSKGSAMGQEKALSPPQAANSDERQFHEFVKPLLSQYCARCHNGEKLKSGVRVDQLSATPDDRQLHLWKRVLRQVADEAMPPEDEPQPTRQQRKELAEWTERTMTAAMARNTQRNGSVRRLTVPQYRNTLRDLLGLDEDLTEGLPPDGLSKDGFANNAQTMVLSPLQVEAYFDIAEKAIDLCVVDEQAKPVIQNFRMDLGRKINPAPCPDKLVLGALSVLLNNDDFRVTELTPKKPFAFQPFRMKTKFDFIEGYVGNDTIREWRKFDGIYHAVFACLRGMAGYPKGEAAQVVPEGLLLRPAIPGPVVQGIPHTYGPMANFKVAVRELPDRGIFRVTVRASRYDDGLLLNPGTPAITDETTKSVSVEKLDTSAEKTVTIAEGGIYQVDVSRVPGENKGILSLELGDRHFAGSLAEYKKSTSIDPLHELAQGFMVVRLAAGAHRVVLRQGDHSTLRRLIFTRIDESGALGRRFAAFERRTPWLGVHVGLRRDCGSTLSPVGEPQRVLAGTPKDFVFTGPINDFPSPDVEPNNVNYLAGIREIAVRSEYSDGRDMPRLLIHSVEFEGPYYTEWPPKTHRDIFIESAHQSDPETYAREILHSFATRAFRRPVTAEERSTLMNVWRESYAEKKDFRSSIKNALLAVLTAPQFLFLIEESAGPEAEDLTEYELASKLSYFLCNAPPDRGLLELAATNRLRQSLDREVERLAAEPRFGPALHEFVSQWLSLDKFDVVAVDMKRFPGLTREAKAQLRQEPVQFVLHLIRNNLPLRNLVHSDFVVANEAVASYYNLGDRTESGLEFVPIRHDSKNLGGVLCQAAVLSGLSDGRESNPVKRGAWFARKIIAEPPNDPPPNVPKLPEDDSGHRTLRQRLERHRNQEGCVKCHSGIDPWGLPFEQYDAAGLFKKEVAIDARSTLPDGAEVENLQALKSHLVNDRIDQVAFSFLKHLACYATGRSLTYNELAFLKAESTRLRPGDYPLRDLIKVVVKSDLFLKK
ncbi:MAG: DUF1592 domain-containing protein [Isosphaeraceae bacterium]|nr:DUF1592 domain-containing protein [Isosphaeraceae bacterium]